MNAGMTSLDWVVMIVFLAVMVGIGLVSTLLIKTTRDYFTGGGKMPWWLLGVSHHVSGYSAVAFTAYAAIAYNTGFTIYIWWAVPISMACFIGIFFIVSRWVRLRTHYGIESPLEYIEVRYNVPTQQILAWWGVLLKILDVGAKWVAVALVMKTFMPEVSFSVAILLSVTLGLFYSTLGGLWAGTLTDFAMFLVQFASGIAMFVIVLIKLGGGTAIWTIWDKLPEGHSHLMAGQYGTWTCILGLLLIDILGYNGGTWNLAQRYIAAPQGSDAKKAAFLSAALYLIWPLVLFFPMWACPLLIPGLEGADQEQSFCMMVIQFLPPGLTGLMLAALVSHTLTMTTADATAITSVVVRDVIPKVWRPAARFNSRQQLFCARLVTFTFMVLTAVVALFNSYFGGIIGLILGWFSALLGPVSVSMILGLLPWFRRCGVWAANGAVAAGVVMFVIIKCGSNWSAGEVLLLPTLVSLIVYCGIGCLSVLCNIPVKKEAADLLNALSNDIPPHRSFKVDLLNVEVYSSRLGLGIAAGKAAGNAIRDAITQKGEARVIFAAAPSQNETLDVLCNESGIDWTKVTALHMDEYVGLPENSPARFGYYLKQHVFSRLPFKKVYLLDDPQLGLSTDELLQRYREILAQAPVDVVIMGIGENGHIAFNDPPVDFQDPMPVKVVELDEVCRLQQVHDGCFPDLDAVPGKAVTLTVPTLLQAERLICAVPGATKTAAVRRTLVGDVSPLCPATILRTHKAATLYVDTDSCDLDLDVAEKTD